MMLLSVILLCIGLLWTGLARAVASQQATQGHLISEILATTSTGVLATNVIWQLRQVLPNLTVITWLVWLLMFLAVVLAIRILGTHLAKTQATTAINLVPLLKGFAYHAAVFWQVMLSIILISSMLSHQTPSSVTTLLFGFVIGVAITIQGTAKFYLLTHN